MPAHYVSNDSILVIIHYLYLIMPLMLVPIVVIVCIKKTEEGARKGLIGLNINRRKI